MLKVNPKCLERLTVMEEFKISTQQIFKTATVDRPIEAVWQLWTTSEGLKSFFGYDNTFELVPGGPFEIYFDEEAPVGEKGSETCKVLSYLPYKMLSFSWNAPPEQGFVRNNPYKTWVVLQFEVKAEGITTVNLHHLGWPEGDAWDEAYRYFEIAWGKVLSWFVEVCAQ